MSVIFRCGSRYWGGAFGLDGAVEGWRGTSGKFLELIFFFSLILVVRLVLVPLKCLAPGQGKFRPRYGEFHTAKWTFWGKLFMVDMFSMVLRWETEKNIWNWTIPRSLLVTSKFLGGYF